MGIFVHILSSRRRLAEALLFMGIKEIPTKYDNDYANMKYFPADWKKYI